MRLTMTAVLMVAAMVVATPVFAELQNVEVGGSIRIRGNYYSPESQLANFADDTNALNVSDSSIEQRTTITVSADFTNDVSAHINIHDHMLWGNGSQDVDVYEGYIETRETFGQPLTLRIGRQELVFGSEWLLGNRDTAAGFTGLSHDAILVAYTMEDMGSITAFASKLAESSPGGVEEDGDNDLYAVYASYTALEEIVIDVYWILRRDATPGGTTIDDLTIFGGRVAGGYMGFDFEAEVAGQSGDHESVSATQEFGGLGATIEVGYTFDMDYQPRVYAGYALFEGASGTDSAFDRLFSDVEYSEFLANGDLTNVNIIRVGASAQVTEAIDVAIAYSLFTVDEETASTDDELGSEIGLYANYAYSEDVTLSVGWAHYLADDASSDGHLVLANGSGALGSGSGTDEDADYIFFETSVSF